MAVSKAKLPKSHSRAALAASLAASAPPSELRAVVQRVALEIHGVYVQKPQGSTDLDLLRSLLLLFFVTFLSYHSYANDEVCGVSGKLLLSSSPLRNQMQS